MGTELYPYPYCSEIIQTIEQGNAENIRTIFSDDSRKDTIVRGSAENFHTISSNEDQGFIKNLTVLSLCCRIYRLGYHVTIL